MLPFNSHRSIERELAGPGINPQGRYQYVDDVGGAYRNPPISFGPPDNVCTFYRLGEAQLGHFGFDSTRGHGKLPSYPVYFRRFIIID